MEIPKTTQRSQTVSESTVNPVIGDFPDPPTQSAPFASGYTTDNTVPISPINPAHYRQNGIETIDVIEAWELDYCLGNAVKYISRAGKKDPDKEVEDLEKAMWYLQRRISKLRRTQ